MNLALKQAHLSRPRRGFGSQHQFAGEIALPGRERLTHDVSGHIGPHDLGPARLEAAPCRCLFPASLHEEAIERAGTAPLTQLMIASQVKGLLGLY